MINNEHQVLPCCTFWGEEMPIKKISKPEDLLDSESSENERFKKKAFEWRI